MLRLFLTSSHLSTVLMAIYARKTWREGYIDILIIDASRRKESMVKLITETSHIYSWHNIYNFSYQVSDQQNMKPSLYKTAIRKLKTKPVVKPLYDLLHQRYTRKFHSALVQRLQNTITEKAGSAELHMLTETALNKPLIEMYPGAGINYFEHGQGDYYYMLEKHLKGYFHCVFAPGYKQYLEKRNIDSKWVRSFLEPGDFEKASRELLEHYPAQSGIIRSACDTQKENALILLDSVEIYNVPFSFWAQLAEKCVSKVTDPSSTHFIIKPHPAQSHEAINAIKDYFRSRNISFSMTDQPELSAMGVEVMFSLWKKHVKYVFTIFSTSVYYLSEFYPGNISYYYAYDFMGKHVSNAPPMYKAHYYGLKDIIKEVLAARCIEF